MPLRWSIQVLFLCFVCSSSARSEDLVRLVKKAADLCTLDQPKTNPFHLKATLAPTSGRIVDSDRRGEVEIWWVSPSQWRREVRSPQFHQVQVVNGTRVWQKNEGEYFPEWLRETSIALIHPVPLTNEVLEQVRTAKVQRLMGNTYLSWAMMSGDGVVQKGLGAGISVTNGTGVLFTAGGLDWGGWFRDYKSFHGREVARTVSWGDPEVTAKITTLEDLGQTPASLFDAGASGGDPQLLETIVLDEASLRKNLLPMQPISWPAVKDGPLEGVLTTRVAIDRSGKVRQISPIISDNPGLSETASAQIGAMLFRPFLHDGSPVQVVSRITLAFKATRPPDEKTFESARVWFERARRIGFPSGGAGIPYVLHAEFQAQNSSGAVQTGQYEDTWLSDSKWRREVTFGSSHYARARNGKKTYLLAEGPDAKWLAFVLQVIEPIPAMDTFVESDWRIRSDDLRGLKTVRILTGYESPDGSLDSERARGFWFDQTGNLVQTFFRGLESRRTDIQDFGSVKVAHRVDVMQKTSLAMRIQVTGISLAGPIPDETFELKGHEWNRSLTAEVR